MKISKTSAFALCFFIIGTTQIIAQQSATKVNPKDVHIQKHTMMEQFEPELVISANQRLVMKNQHAAEIRLKRSILDTLTISNRKKRRLLRDLKNSPFSQRLERATLVDTKFQDETDNNK